MQMPRLIYVSFDIDGLEPSLCPHTGTPVPGGLSFEHAVYLIQEISRQNKKIIGFDLCGSGSKSLCSLTMNGTETLEHEYSTNFVDRL